MNATTWRESIPALQRSVDELRDEYERVRPTLTLNQRWSCRFGLAAARIGLLSLHLLKRLAPTEGPED